MRSLSGTVFARITMTNSSRISAIKWGEISLFGTVIDIEKSGCSSIVILSLIYFKYFSCLICCLFHTTGTYICSVYFTKFSVCSVRQQFLNGVY